MELTGSSIPKVFKCLRPVKVRFLLSSHFLEWRLLFFCWKTLVLLICPLSDFLLWDRMYYVSSYNFLFFQLLYETLSTVSCSNVSRRTLAWILIKVLFWEGGVKWCILCFFMSNSRQAIFIYWASRRFTS